MKGSNPATFASLGLLTLALGCATTPVRETSQRVAQAPPSFDSTALSLAARADSSALASLIGRSCGKAKEKGDCIEKALALVAGKGQVKVAMGALNYLGAGDADIRRTGHVYAHAIGIAAGSGRGDVAESFRQCSESYQSGCYHGVIQAWFAGLDSVSQADANALCEPFRKSESDRWIRFQCVHGMGHGLTMLYNHNLPKGLAGCDLLTEWWDKHSCYSGAFMENIVNVTMPHHPASALAHHDGQSEDHAGMEGMEGMDHDMAGMHHDDVPFKPVDPEDPLYPCSVLPERYLSACYEMQTSVMLHNNKGDIAGAGRACETAPLNMRPTCFASLGRDVSSYSLQNHAEAIRMCSLASVKYQPWCYYGLVKNLVDLDARAADGMSMCRDVTSPDGKTLCYDAVGEQILILAPEVEARRRTCETAEAEYVDVCLYGARVAVQAPPVLVRLWDAVRH